MLERAHAVLRRPGFADATRPYEALAPLSRKPGRPEARASAAQSVSRGASMPEVEASSRAGEFVITPCQVGVCRRVRLVAFRLLHRALVHGNWSALVYQKA